MSDHLDGKIVLITGSARGIGAATARLAYKNGAKVILHGKRPSEALDKLSKELDNAPTVTFDVSSKAEVEQSIQTMLDKFGKIDVLVNSAGMVKPKPFLETEDADWYEHISVNVLGIVHACQAVIPTMLENNYGRIVNVASTRGHQVLASNRIMAYSASKAAVINLTASLAKEFAPTIAVNAVSPSFTNTEMSQNWNDTVHQQVKTALLGRAAEPHEIAEAIIFLAGDGAGFITGQTLLVDGGYSMSGK